MLPLDIGDAVQKEATSAQQSHSTFDVLSGRHAGQRPWDFIHSTQGRVWKLTVWSRGKHSLLKVDVFTVGCWM